MCWKQCVRDSSAELCHRSQNFCPCGATILDVHFLKFLVLYSRKILYANFLSKVCLGKANNACIEWPCSWDLSAELCENSQNFWSCGATILGVFFLNLLDWRSRKKLDANFLSKFCVEKANNACIKSSALRIRVPNYVSVAKISAHVGLQH